MKNPKISACLLASYETTLSRCLLSIKDYVDEIIVVDTTEKLVNKKIALQFTDKFYSFKWSNNFSEARNFSIKKALGDWILIVDPDEYVINPALLKENIKINKETYYLKRYSLDSNGKVFLRDKIVRIFRNNKGYKFYGLIYEALVDINMKEFSTRTILEGPILYHTGYSRFKIDEMKSRRNFKLLNRELKELPNRNATYFYLANYYFNKARFLLIEKGEITQMVIALLNKSKATYMHYISIIPEDELESYAKELYDLCNIILLFRSSINVKKLITWIQY